MIIYLNTVYNFSQKLGNNEVLAVDKQTEWMN